MIPVIVFVSTPKRLATLLIVLLVVALVPEVLSLFQILTHKPLSPHTIVAWIKVGGLSIPRSYVLSFNLTGVALLCLLGTYLYSSSGRVRLLSSVVAVAVLAGVILTFGRAFWMATIGGMLFLFIVAAAETSMRTLVLRRTLALWLRIGVVTILAVIFLGLIGREGSLLRLSSLVGRRFVSTFTEVTEFSGSFGGRLEEGAFRLALFRRSPVLGVGYVHRTSEFASEIPEKNVGTADSGVITVLAQNGVVGLIAIAALAVVFLRRGFFVFKSTRQPLLKGVSLGIVAYYVHSLITFVGLTGIVFTHYAGICTMGLMVGLQEVILRIDTELAREEHAT
jgi:O-antigen ligase